MPGPPAINWYRADLRSPLPGGLWRPADHLYQSLLFFFSSPACRILPCSVREARSIGCRAERTAGKMAKSGELGGQVSDLSCIDGPGGSLRGGSGTRWRKHVLSICFCVRVLIQCFSCRLLLVKRSPFRTLFFVLLAFWRISLLLLSFSLVILGEDTLSCI